MKSAERDRATRRVFYMLACHVDGMATLSSLEMVCGGASFTCCTQTELIQCRSFVGVCPSRKNTCPRCEPQLLQHASAWPWWPRRPTWHWSPV